MDEWFAVDCDLNCELFYVIILTHFNTMLGIVKLYEYIVDKKQNVYSNIYNLYMCMCAYLTNNNS